MKRHPVLHQLTEDHHHGLVAARHLQEAEEKTIAGRVRAFLSQWRSAIGPHFIEEEQALLPFVCPPVDPGHPLLAEMLRQHLAIRRLVLDLQRAHAAEDTAALLTTAHAIGEALDAHIRLEEREVFVHLEESLSPDELTELGKHLLAWEGARAGCLIG